MRKVSYLTSAVAALALVVFVAGCGAEKGSGDPKTKEMSGPPPAGDDDHGHEHAEEHEGPHGGHVIELGRSHEYHAELVDDEQAETVTVYILDKDMKELPVAATSITMNLLVDGEAKTYELASAGASGGKASRFDAADNAVFEALHEHEATGKLRLTINGTPYSGEIEHHHHGDDDHDHGEHDHGDGHKH